MALATFAGMAAFMWAILSLVVSACRREGSKLESSSFL
jgi:hypothetical protein